MTDPTTAAPGAPLIIEPSQHGGALTPDSATCAAWLEALSTHGALLFRGFAVDTAEQFDAWVGAFGLEGFTYEASLSNAVRRNRTPRVFTANEAPPHVEIFLHHEMAQTPLFPRQLFFCCEQAPTSGGATPLRRSDQLLCELERALPEFVEACRARGVRYTYVMPADTDSASGQGRSWRDTLSVGTREEAEHRLASLGYGWSWQEHDSLRVLTPMLPAIRRAPSGQEVFFNQLIAAFCGWQDRRNEARRSVLYGDGSDIPVEDLEEVARIAYAGVFDLEWQAGDVALIDNYLVMHGRRPFKGSRSVLASLAGIERN
ncbi:MAG: TauD/TfdA family dioxygenase [Steroidobacteraceae bacterium]